MPLNHIRYVTTVGPDQRDEYPPIEDSVDHRDVFPLTEAVPYVSPAPDAAIKITFKTEWIMVERTKHRNTWGHWIQSPHRFFSITPASLRRLMRLITSCDYHVHSSRGFTKFYIGG